MKNCILLLFCLAFISCGKMKELNCSDFKNGTFEYSYKENEKTITSTFIRKDSIEIDYVGKNIDTIQVRWLNDCEYIVQNKNPETYLEKKAIHIKILSTTENSYTFESSYVIKNPNTNYKQVGTVTKIKD